MEKQEQPAFTAIDGMDIFKDKLEQVFLDTLETCLVKYGKDTLASQIASKFPDHVNQVVDEFIAEEIKPELLGYLKKNKGRILEGLKEGVVGRAVEASVGRLV